MDMEGILYVYFHIPSELKIGLVNKESLKDFDYIEKRLKNSQEFNFVDAFIVHDDIQGIHISKYESGSKISCGREDNKAVIKDAILAIQMINEGQIFIYYPERWEVLKKYKYSR